MVGKNTINKYFRRDISLSIKRGEIYYADLRPVVGSEQGGIRPVLIVQNDIVLNQKCAMTVMNTKVLFFTAIKKNVPFIIVVLKKKWF